MNSAKVAFARRLIRWYDRHRRQLPWRSAPGTRPDPYYVLVSEAMLQQTQVKTVVPYFIRFIKKFPTMSHLVRADQQVVLTLWQGLGYYSRARNLQRAAQIVVAEYEGQVPSEVESLLKLPGIGRYTAGAIASLAYDVSAPIVDGNVARVLCRLDAIETAPSLRSTQTLLWERAGQLVPLRRAGDFNSALMELGATVCTSRSPQCEICPIRKDCRALALGIQERIPPPRPARQAPLVVRQTFCVRRSVNGQTQFLIEQRPARGRWPELWQFVTTNADSGAPSAGRLRELACVKTSAPRRIATIKHALSHRRYRFDVYLCDVRGRCRRFPSDNPRQWISLDALASYPLPRPQVRVAAILSEI